jgi:hypothetical protein
MHELNSNPVTVFECRCFAAAMLNRHIYKTAVSISVIDVVELRCFVLQESCQNITDFRNTFRHVLYFWIGFCLISFVV